MGDTCVLRITGMRCAARCAPHVAKALLAVEGVAEATVDFRAGTATVRAQQLRAHGCANGTRSTTLEARLLEAVSGAGPSPCSGQQLHAEVASSSGGGGVHPLEPLSGAEVVAAANAIKAMGELSARCRFISCALHEPSKQQVAVAEAVAAGPVPPLLRAAHVVVLDCASRETFEFVVALDGAGARILTRTRVAGQPAITPEECEEAQIVVKAHAGYRSALAKRGIADMDLVCVDAWSVGAYHDDDPADAGLRLARALTFVKRDVHDNHFAHPVDGLLVMVDLHAMAVLRVEDHELVPVPAQSTNYSARHMDGRWRAERLRPIHITQPEGVSFRVDGHAIAWQGWHFRIGFNSREGLTLHRVGYAAGGEGAAEARPILHRASLVEMTVPYGDGPSVTQQRKCAFDVGEFGVGSTANSLALGCDCVGDVTYFDAALVDSAGELFTISNAVCLHEEDAGMLWKHTDWRTGEVEVRRARRLVVSSVCTVENYEYG